MLRRETRDNKLSGLGRVDIKYTPLFKLKVSLFEMISPAWPLGWLYWEGLEKVRH